MVYERPVINTYSFTTPPISQLNTAYLYRFFGSDLSNVHLLASQPSHCPLAGWT